MTRLGIFSDIHGNLQAFEAVLAAMEEDACDVLICCGDTVGYGAQPGECLNLIREREIPCVMGNHDHYMTMLMDPRIEKMRPDVRQSIEWTQAALSMDDLKWLAELPMRLDVEDFDISLVHGAFGPKRWRYCTTRATFMKNFEHQDVRLGFCGHSHVPALGFYREGDQPAVKHFRETPLPDAERIMINVGSVGQPRDKDPRASYVLLDLEEEIVCNRRIPYDIEKAQALIREAGLPERSAERLGTGK
ncbi:MAG: metallophosphoesterase family protein [Lentisphaeria bacterium]|nr:metallophosphoesterase family protein [Lentisphaeria bacterium]